MGIKPQHNAAISIDVARGWAESIYCHLVHPDKDSQIMAENLIQSISGPRNSVLSHATRGVHLSICRLVLDDALADDLGIDQEGITYWILCRALVYHVKFWQWAFNLSFIKAYADRFALYMRDTLSAVTLMRLKSRINQSKKESMSVSLIGSGTHARLLFCIASSALFLHIRG